MKKIVTMDLETYSADDKFRRKDFVRLGGYGSPGAEPVLTTDGDEIARACAEADIVITHNGFAFDFPALAQWHGLDLRALRGKVIDTDNLVRLDDPPPSGKDDVAIRPRGYYGLDASCKRYRIPAKTDDLARLGRQYASLHNKISKGKPLTKVEKARAAVHGPKLAELAERATYPDGKIDPYGMIPEDDAEFRSYLQGDLTATYGLGRKLAPLNDYAKREMVIGLFTAQTQVNGFRVDVPELHRALDEQADRRRRHLHELSDLTGMQLKGTTPIRSKDGNEAIRRALIQEGLRPAALPMTESTGMMATGREALGELLTMIRAKANGRDIRKIERIIELTISISGERTVYQTAEKTRVDDRVHPTTRPLQASGRWSVTGPGLTVYGKRQGRHVERRIFLPEEGHVLVCFDADQVDARGVAAHSGDEAYLEIFRWRGPNGERRDLHGEVALQLFGDVKFREMVKQISHGWNYGESVRKIAASGVPYDLAETFDREMREKYPDLVAWQTWVRRQAKLGQLLDNGFGRKMRADPRFAHTQAPALVGQGCTRDIIGEGIVRLPMEFWPYARVIVHDEIVFSLPENDWEEMSREILKAMEFDLADVTDGRLASVPITAGHSRPGHTWAQCYEK